MLGILRARQGQRKKKPRVGAMKTGKHAKRAAARYTVKVVRKPLLKTARRQSAWGEGGRRQKFLADEAVAEPAALRQLVDAKYATVPLTCSNCGEDLLPDPEKKRESWYWRCGNHECQHRHPVLRYTPWPSTKLKPSQLTRAIREYTNYDRLAPPEVDDIAKAAGAGRYQIRSVVEFLRKKEGARARLENETGTISGDLELDAHEVAKLHISPDNEHYKHLLPKQHAQHPEPYYQLFVRVGGLRQRGRGWLHIEKLKDHVLLPPKARPPPESKEEWLEADILRHAGKGSMIHPDGAQCVPAVVNDPRYRAKKLRLPKEPVSHKQSEFTKPIRKKAGYSSLTGTQSADRSWKELDRAIPDTLHRKQNHQLNPEVMERIWAWLHRYNHAPVDDGFKHVGNLVNWQ